MKTGIKFTDIVQTYSLIKEHVHKTPVLTSSYLNNLAGANLFFKCENFQKVGAFKYRGAFNTLFRMKKLGFCGIVTTHSSGNHAQAVALAAKTLGFKAIIVMPENSSSVKIEAVRNYGAEIIFCRPGDAERQNKLEEVEREFSAVPIHPYQDIYVIMGQGTVSYEFFSQVENLNSIICPVGGGGLLAGTAISTKNYFHFSLTPKVYGAEPNQASDTYQSLASGKRITKFSSNTICDGLRTGIGDINFTIIQNTVESILLAEENEIIQATKLIWERLKILVEPSAAISLAVVLKNKELFKNQNVGIILSGGNVDLDNLPW